MQKAILCCFVVISLLPNGPVYAQQPPDETYVEWERRREAERRAREEERAVDVEARAWLGEFMRLPTVEEIEAMFRRDAQRFNSDVGEFVRIAKAISYYSLAPMSERWAVESLGDESRELEGRADRILLYMTEGYSVTGGPTLDLADYTTRQKLSILNRFALEVVPKLTSLTGGDVLDIGLYTAVIEELFEIKALTRALQP